MPPKKDPKQEYEAFLKDIAADVQEADKREQDDAAEAATERAERERHEQRWAGETAGMSCLLGCLGKWVHSWHHEWRLACSSTDLQPVGSWVAACGMQEELKKAAEAAGKREQHEQRWAGARFIQVPGVLSPDCWSEERECWTCFPWAA